MARQLGLGFQNNEAEPEAVTSRRQGPAQLGLYRFSLGWSTAQILKAELGTSLGKNLYLFVLGIWPIIASPLFPLAARNHPSFTPRLRSMPETAFSWIPHCYPPTYRSDHIDVYQSEAQGEVKVPDPYAWLEKDGEERKRWLASQEALARKVLDSHPDRAALEEEIRSSTDYERVSSLIL